MQCVAFCLVLYDTGVGRHKLLLIKRLAKTFAGFFHLFAYLLIILRDLVFDEDIGTVTLLGILVVNQRIVECVHMPRCFPYSGVHEDGRVNAHDVLMQQDHTLPPIFLYIVLQFHSILAIVVDSPQAIINVARWENETILLTM